MIGLLPAALGQTTMANSFAVTLASIQSALLTSANGKVKVNQVLLDMGTTNVTTAAYVQLLASTAAASTELEIFVGSGEVLAFAVGAAASEVVQFNTFPGGQGIVKLSIASGQRLSVKSLTANVTSGYLVVNTFA